MLSSNGMPVLQVRLSHILLTVVIVGVLFHATRLRQNRRSFTIHVPDTSLMEDVLPEEEYLKRLVDRYVLTNLTKWQAWRVQTSEEPLDMGSITDVHADFQPDRDTPKVVDVDNPSYNDLRAAKALELAAHTDQAQDTLYAWMLMFGISTSYERIVANDWAVLRAWKRWLTKSDGTTNGASLVLMLDNANEKQLDEIDKGLEETGIDVYTISTSEPTSKIRRYYELIRIMKSYSATIAAGGQEKHWFAVIEDTVFFPSLSYLQERLSAFNFSKQLYIGTPSEKMEWQDGKSGRTYGGGAVFLTKYAVSSIPKLSCLRIDAALKGPFHGQMWDTTLKQCLEKQAGIDMHVIPAFYSPHYEARLKNHETGMRPLLLRDNENRHRLDVGMAHLVTDACGEACFMHQYLFHDNWVIINGVSITHHPDGLGHDHDRHRHRDHYQHHQHHHHDAAEKGGLFRYIQKAPISDQIVRDKNEAERRAMNWVGRMDVWRLLDSAKGSDGTIWQAYVKRGEKSTDEDKKRSDGLKELDSVIVLIWENKQQ